MSCSILGREEVGRSSWMDRAVVVLVAEGAGERKAVVAVREEARASPVRTGEENFMALFVYAFARDVNEPDI